MKSHGRAGIRKGLERLWRWKRTSHHFSNIQMHFAGADPGQRHQLHHCLARTPAGRQHGHDLGAVSRYLRAHASRLAPAASAPDHERQCAGFTVNVFPSERRQPPAGWVAVINST